MLTPPTSNNPRPPRDKDEWVAILIALGVLGGTAGWILFGGLPSLRLGVINERLSDIRPELPNLSAPIVSLEDEASTDSSLTEAETLIPRTADADAMADVENGETSARLGRAADGLLNGDEAQRSQGPSEIDNRQTEPGDSTAVTPAHSPEVVVPEPQLPGSAVVDPLPVVQESLTFSDIPENHWAKPYIDALTARGILAGLPDGSYAPDRPMTRAELAAQVANAFEIAPDELSEAFTDIPAGYWATQKIDEAVTTGFMKGYPDKTFGPDQTVPRVQVLVTFVTGLALPSSITAETRLQQYSDQTEIPQWATQKVASALEANLVTVPAEGNGQLRPNDEATRAEVAVMLHKALAYIGKVDPILPE